MNERSVAQVKLSLFREDFDVKHVDALCMALHGTRQYEKALDWLLDTRQAIAVFSTADASLRSECMAFVLFAAHIMTQLQA